MKKGGSPAAAFAQPTAVLTRLLAQAAPGVRPATYQTETPLPAVVDAYCARLAARGRSLRTLDSVPPLLRSLARFHPGPIGIFDAATLERFIESRGTLANRTKNNYLQTVGSLIRYAQRQRFLPPWYDEHERLEPWTVTPEPPGIYTPQELRAILANAYSTLIPGIACLAFAGLRTAELHRVQWLSVDCERGLIFIDGQFSKTRQRRLCPIPANLKDWLTPRRQADTAPLYAGTRKSFNELLRRSLDKARVEPKRNGLRHSFCSYRLAICQDAARVSLEAGNSPGMLFRHYREAVTPAAAAEWFSITPQAGRQLEFRL